MADETSRSVVQFGADVQEALGALDRIVALLEKVQEAAASTDAQWKSVIHTMGETSEIRILGMDKLLESVQAIQGAMSTGTGVSRQYAEGLEKVALRAKGVAQAQDEVARATRQVETFWAMRAELRPEMAGGPGPQDALSISSLMGHKIEGAWALREELQAGGVSDAYQMAQLSENERMYIDAIHKQGQALGAQVAGTRQAEEAQEDLTKAMKAGGEATEESTGFLGGLGRSFQTHLRWMVRYIVLWKGMQVIQSTAQQWFQVNMELDRSLTLLETSVGGNITVMREYRDAMFAAAQAGRALPTEMAPAAVMTGRIYDPEEAGAVMTRAAELAFLSGGKVTDITGQLIVMQRQLGIESEEMGSIMDALAGSLRNTHLSYADLLPMLNNAVIYSQRFNMTVEETIGLQAGIAGATGATSSQLDSMLRRLQDIYVVGSKANVTLANMGVATVLVGESGEQVLRPMDEIIADIGRAAGTSQADIERLSDALFRTGSANRLLFEAMIRNAPQVTQGIRNATQAMGEWNKTVGAMGNTWAGATQSMATSWQQFLASIKLDTELIEFVTGFATAMGFMAEQTMAASDAYDDARESLGGFGAMAQAYSGILSIAMGPFFGIVAPRVQARIAQALGAVPPPAAGDGGERGVVGEQVTYPRLPPSGVGGPQLPMALDVRTMTLEVPEGASFTEVMSSYEDATNRWIQTFVDQSGKNWRISQEMITDAEEQILMWDEASQQFRLLNVFLPALQEAIQENTAALKAPSLRFTQFDPVAGAGGIQRLVSHYDKIARSLGWDEDPEQQVLWGPEDSILQLSASNIVLQMVMHSLTEAVNKNTEALNEGMWNIPEGVTALVPITSLFYQNLNKPGGGNPFAGVDLDVLADAIIGQGTTIAGTYDDGAGVGGRTRGFFTGGPEGEMWDSAYALNQSAASLTSAAYALQSAARAMDRDSYDIYLPPIPKLAAGGIVTGPMLAMLGDRGPEAVVPLGSGGGVIPGQDVAVNITLMLDERILAEVTRKAVAEVL